MTKEVICSASEIPLGSVIKDSLFSESGILLLSEGTVVDDSVYEALSKYKKPIKVIVDVDDIPVSPNINTGFSLTEEIKERTKQGVEYIYNNPNSKDTVDIANDVSDSLLTVVNASSDINVSLNSIKISDEYTFKHCVDVATMGVLLGRYLHLDDRFLKDIVVAGILHDLGKTKIPDNILNKTGKLTDTEYNIIKLHPLYGYNLVQNSNELSHRAKLGILHHHEKYDGTGYPRGLKGEKISLIGRLLSIVDVYDALVTKRPYRDGIIEPATAIEMVMSMSSQFDIKLLRAFLNCIIIYPIGSLVLLSDNNVYEIVAQNEGYPTRPVVRDVLSGKELDLLSDFSCLSLVILSGVSR